MTTRTSIRYHVQIADTSSSFAPDRYSKYYDRLSLQGKGVKIEVYGPEQCREHIAELRQHSYEGKKIYADADFEIVRTITIEETFPAGPSLQP